MLHQRTPEAPRRAWADPPDEPPIGELLRIDHHVPIRFKVLARRILQVDPRGIEDAARDLYPHGWSDGQTVSLRQVQRWLTRSDVRATLMELWFPVEARKRYAPHRKQVDRSKGLPPIEAAAMIGISAKMLTRMTGRGEGPSFVWGRHGGRACRRYPVAELRRWAQENGRALRPF